MSKYVYKKKFYSFLASFVDAVGYRLTRRPSKPIPPPETILVIRMDHIGDVLSSTPIPRLLKKKYPSAKVIFLTANWASALLEKNPHIDEIILYDAPWFSKGRPKFPSELSWGALKKLLRSKKIDLGITLRGDVREILLMKQSRIPVRAGYGVTGGGFFLTHETTHRTGIHEIDHNLEVLKTLGIPVEGNVLPEIYLDEGEEESLEGKWASLGLREGESYVGVLVESGLASKNWPKTHLMSFLNQLSERHPRARVVLVGSDAKLPLTPSADSLQLNDLRGKTSLRDLCFLIKKFSLFVGPDSGPTHLSATLGIPTVFLYSGINDLAQWGPRQSWAVVLKEGVPCSPCGLTVCNREGHPCMENITPEAVLDVIDPILSAQL